MTKIIKANSIVAVDPTSAKYVIATDKCLRLWFSPEFAIELQSDGKNNAIESLGSFYKKFRPYFTRLGVDGDLLVKIKKTISITSIGNIVTILHKDLSTTEIIMDGDYKIVPFNETEE